MADNYSFQTETAMMQSYRVGRNQLDTSVLTIESMLNKQGSIDIFTLEVNNNLTCTYVDPDASTGRVRTTLAGKEIVGVQVSPNLVDPETPELYYQRAFAWSRDGGTTIHEIKINRESKTIELETVGTVGIDLSAAKSSIGLHDDGLFMVLGNVIIRLDQGAFGYYKTEIPGIVKPRMKQSSNGSWPLVKLVAAESGNMKGWSGREVSGDTVLFGNVWGTGIDSIHPKYPQFDFSVCEDSEGKASFYQLNLGKVEGKYNATQLIVTEVVQENDRYVRSGIISRDIELPIPDDNYEWINIPPELKITAERNNVGDTSIFTSISMVTYIYVPPYMGAITIDQVSLKAHLTKTYLREKPEDPMPEHRSWTKMMPFHEEAMFNTILTSNRLPNSKFPMTYIVSNEGRIIEYYQRQYADKNSYQKRWSSKTVEWDDASKPQEEEPLLEGKCFHTTIRLVDEHKEPVPLTEVFITPSNYYPCLLNGKFTQMTALTPQAATTNAAGEISVEYELEHSGHAPSLVVSLEKEGHTEDNSEKVIPDDAVYKRYKTVSDQDLLANLGGYQVIPPHLSGAVGAVGNAIRNICSHQLTSIGNSMGTGGRKLEPNPNQSPWVLSFSEGIPSYREIDQKELEELKQQYPDISTFRDHPNFQDLGFNPFNWIATTVGDAIEAVVSTGAQIVDYIVDGIKAQINFVMEELQFSLPLEIAVVRDALGFVQVIFDKVGTAAGTVIGWTMNLLGFLFNWDEIKRMKEMVENQYNAGWESMADGVTQRLHYTADNIESLIDHLSTTLSGPFQMSPEQGGDKKMDSFGTGGIMDLLPANSGSAINPINKFFDLATNPSSLFRGRINFEINTDEIRAQLAVIMAKIQSKLQAEGETTVNRLQELINPPEAFAEKTFNELLNLIKECILTVPEILTEIKTELKGLIEKVIGCVRQTFEALKAEVYIPVLSNIYKGIFGTPMTILGMIALLTAIPLSFSGTDFADTVSIEAACIVAAVMSCLSAILAILLDGVHHLVGDFRTIPVACYFALTAVSMIVLAQTDGIKTDEVIIRIIYVVFAVSGLLASFAIQDLSKGDCKSLIGGVEAFGGTILTICCFVEIFVHKHERYLLGGMLADSGRFLICGGARLVDKFRIPVVVGVNVGLGGTAAGLYGHEAHIS